MKRGDHIETLAAVEDAFRDHPDVNRIMVERQGERLFLVTQMDGWRPNNLRQTAKMNGMIYEIRRARGYEQVHAYDIPTDTIRYVFYRLNEQQQEAA